MLIVDVLCMCGIYVTSACTRERDPSYVALFQVSSFSLKGLFQFFLTRFEGLMEAVATMQIMKQGKQCLSFWAQNKFGLI